MAEWADPRRIKKIGDEPAPIVAPIFVPMPKPVEVEAEPEKVLVPVRR